MKKNPYDNFGDSFFGIAFFYLIYFFIFTLNGYKDLGIASIICATGYLVILAACSIYDRPKLYFASHITMIIELTVHQYFYLSIFDKTASFQYILIAISIFPFTVPLYSKKITVILSFLPLSVFFIFDVFTNVTYKYNQPAPGFLETVKVINLLFSFLLMIYLLVSFKSKLYALYSKAKKERKLSEITSTYKVSGLFHLISKLIREKRATDLFTIFAFAELIESRDESTGSHVKRSTAYVQILCEQLLSDKVYPDVLTNEKCRLVIESAAMHDIGKIKIADAILLKPGKLTDDEKEEMKKHTEKGALILKDILRKHPKKLQQVAYNIANYHHEKWNGTGYPLGLKRDDIPICARIMAIADTYDAMTGNRCYKTKPSSHNEAVQEIKSNANTQFDPVLVDEFLKCEKRIERQARYLSKKDIA